MRGGRVWACLLVLLSGCGADEMPPDPMTDANKVAPALAFVFHGRGLAEWRSQLDSPTPHERVTAVQALSELAYAPEHADAHRLALGEGSAPPWLISGIQDPSLDVRTAAWLACKRLRVLPDFERVALDGPEWAPLRGGSTWPERGLGRAFVDALAVAPRARARLFVVEIVATGHEEASTVAEAWLGPRVHLPGAAQRLGAWWTRRSWPDWMQTPADRAEAIAQLERLATRQGASARSSEAATLLLAIVDGPRVAAWLKSGRIPLRFRAARALGRLQRGDLLAPYLEEDAGKLERFLALTGIKELEDPHLVPLLETLLQMAATDDREGGRARRLIEARRFTLADEITTASRRAPQATQAWLASLSRDR